jgi:molybdopterin molybdotransferase
MRSFFKVKTAPEVLDSLKDIHPLGVQTISITNGLNRVLARDIVSSENIPGFQRSTVDGYALDARDTFGANESLPTPLVIVGEVKMGQVPDFGIKRGQCAFISTGGMLPQGADAVVMVEYAQRIEETVIEITRPVSPLENVILADDDIKEGQTILQKGTLLRAQDLGVLAGLGIEAVVVFRRPRAAIISTGEELVDITGKPEPGQVRDINSYTVGGLCAGLGVKPVYLGLSGDNFGDLKVLLEKGLSQADVILLSGGSSVGAKDMTLDLFLSFADVELVAHGVSISPGKPTIVARKGNKTLWGLPGHPVSAMIIFDVFLRYLFARLSGLADPADYSRHTVEAELDRNIESASGREDYIRVKLVAEDGKLVAKPILGKSGLISTMVEADGIMKIDINTEGLYRGDTVRVSLF